MFFQGSLQDGISTALQQAKLVVCFVTDQGDESQSWEEEFLVDDSIKDSLESQAVLLRLLAGSQEASYLEQLFPVPKKPTLVVIHNGQLKEYIPSGTSKADFTRRVSAAFAPSPAPQPRQTPTPASTSAPAGRTLAESQPATSQDDDLYGDEPDHPTSPSGAQAEASSSQPPNQQAAAVAAALAERAKRLEAEKKAKDAAERAEREARAKARREEAAAGGDDQAQSSKKAAASSHAQQMRQQKAEAAEERRRILKRIEDDRRERKEREAQERQARLLANAQPQDDAGEAGPADIPLRPTATTTPPASTAQTHGDKPCSIQVRQLDGSTMRTRFSRAGDATLAADVRDWVDAERSDGGGGSPYTFRVVLTPLPNRAIAPGEEAQSLASLGLAPSATLVLVPKPSALAYGGSGGRGGGGGNFIWRGVAFVLGLLAACYGMLTAALASVFAPARVPTPVSASGRGGSTAPAQAGARSSSAAPETGRSRIVGFDNPNDARRRQQPRPGGGDGRSTEGGGGDGAGGSGADDPQLYNGNSLNFEPRSDDKDQDGTEDR